MKYYKILGGLVMLVLIVRTILDMTFDLPRVCGAKQNFVEDKFSGTVDYKFSDEKNHNLMTVVLKSKKSIALIRDSAFYNFVHHNDSLKKEINTDAIVVYRSGKSYRFNLNFGCTNE